MHSPVSVIKICALSLAHYPVSEVLLLENMTTKRKEK
jgi:hypothetical protein